MAQNIATIHHPMYHSYMPWILYSNILSKSTPIMTS